MILGAVIIICLLLALFGLPLGPKVVERDITNATDEEMEDIMREINS